MPGEIKEALQKSMGCAGVACSANNLKDCQTKRENNTCSKPKGHCY